MISSCPSVTEFPHKELGMLIVASEIAMKYLEKVCLILPPPSLKGKQGTKRVKRPAFYLLKILVSLASSYFLVPAAAKVYVPITISAMRQFLENVFGIIDDREKWMPLKVPDHPIWVCEAETVASKLHLSNLVYEMVFAFRMRQHPSILLHHTTSIMLLLGRIGMKTPFDSDWIWVAFSWHLYVYSVSLVRPCYSFVKHFMAENCTTTIGLDSLFHVANITTWALIHWGYFLVCLILMCNGEYLQLFQLMVVVSLLFYGSLKEIIRNKNKVQNMN